MANNDDTPYLAIDTLTDKVLGRYASANDAFMALGTVAVDVSYKPRKRIAKKKEFPYNG